MNPVDHEDERPWRSTVRPAVVLLGAFAAATIAYTGCVAAAARLLGGGPAEALVLDAARAAAWAGPEWFHGRPTAATGGVSGGSNLGPTNPTLAAAATARIAAIRAENPTHEGPIPVDLVTSSASGLDPHISPPAAYLQVARVAARSGLPEDDVRRLVERSVEPRSLGVFGQPRVNVVRLNDGLREMAGQTRREGRRGSP